MPSETIDQATLSPSFYFEEMRYPAERQIGFRKPESMHDYHGPERMIQPSESRSVSSSPLGKLLPMRARSVECSEPTPSSVIRGLNAMDHSAGISSNMFVQSASQFVEGNKDGINVVQYENSLFSSSLSEIFSKNLRLSSNDVRFGQSADVATPHYEEVGNFESLEEIEAQTIGNLLPDDDDLLSGVLDDLEYIAQPNGGDDLEDFDLFSSGGGMELEGDDERRRHPGVNGAIPREHLYGEHPSRTLFVRNISSNVEDSDLKAIFEQYGDIHVLYTACKHRGFVMISYYDIRGSCSAMRALQNQPLRRRKLDIHFSIPKDNPSERDTDPGTLAVFNLDSSVSYDYIHQIFGIYGDIREIRETPYNGHHKSIEYYDVRAAEAALRALNRTNIAGKEIKLEPSRPGAARQCSMQQFSSELEQEEPSMYRQQGSPLNDSSLKCLDSFAQRVSTSNYMENGSIDGLYCTTRTPISSFLENGLHHGISSMPHSLSSPRKVASVRNQSGLGETVHSPNQLKFGLQCIQNFQPHSLPEYHDGIAHGVPYNSPGTIGRKISSRPSEGIDNRHVQGMHLNGHSVEPNESVFGSSGNGSRSLHQYSWNNSSTYHPQSPDLMMLPNSPSFVHGVRAHPLTQHGLPRAPSHLMNTSLAMQQHHVGSAPTMNNSIWDRRHAYAGESPEASGFQPGSLGNMGLSGSSPMHLFSPHNVFIHAGGNCTDQSIASPNIGLHSPQQKGHMFPGRNPMVPMPNSYDTSNERVRIRRNEASSNQADNKKLYELNVDRILRGEDTRTTLMIKNIPNKYTSKMLLAAIDERHRGAYDFIYLPIDFKNKCNVGYAFINMTDPIQIVPLYQAFNGKKWEKFNSEKVASLAYARIQGKAALVAHFQNSSLMNEDKRCRPILFHSDGPNAGDQEPFPVGVTIRSRIGKTRTSSNEVNPHGSPSNSASGEEQLSNCTEELERSTLI